MNPIEPKPTDFCGKPPCGLCYEGGFELQYEELTGRPSSAMTVQEREDLTIGAHAMHEYYKSQNENHTDWTKLVNYISKLPSEAFVEKMAKPKPHVNIVQGGMTLGDPAPDDQERNVNIVMARRTIAILIEQGQPVTDLLMRQADVSPNTVKFLQSVRGST